MALDANNRLKEHNAGKNRYTKGHLPWKIIYTEVHPDWASARIREKYFTKISFTLRQLFLSLLGGEKSEISNCHYL
ncbi:MAG: GIY-YIG nuclease family protein [Ginsengibacter sp.]